MAMEGDWIEMGNRGHKIIGRELQQLGRVGGRVHCRAMGPKPWKGHASRELRKGLGPWLWKLVPQIGADAFSALHGFMVGSSSQNDSSLGILPFLLLMNNY